MSKNELFLRSLLELDNQYTFWIKQKLNINTISRWSKRKTIKLYNHSYEQWYLQYRFHILRLWYLNNKNNHEKLETKLNKVIKSLMLYDFLNAKEKNFLINLADDKFTRIRNIKSLVTDFDLNKSEVTYFRYLIQFFKFNNKTYQNVSLYLSNQRIIVIAKEFIISFYFENITNFKIDHAEQMSFSYFNHKYILITNKTKILKTSLERLGRW